MRAWTGKEWDPENQHGDIWEDPDEGENIEPLNSIEVSLPVEAAIQPPFEANNPDLPEENEMAPPKELSCKILQVHLRTHAHHSSLLLNLS